MDNSVQDVPAMDRSVIGNFTARFGKVLRKTLVGTPSVVEGGVLPQYRPQMTFVDDEQVVDTPDEPNAPNAPQTHWHSEREWACGSLRSAVRQTPDRRQSEIWRRAPGGDSEGLAVGLRVSNRGVGLVG